MDIPLALQQPIAHIMVFIAVVCLHGLMALLAHRVELWRPFHWYCQRLAQKVNRAQNSPQQRFIAGSLSYLITVIPLVIILALFENLVAIPLMWQGLLLFVALDGVLIPWRGKQIAQHLIANQKDQAKQQLQPLMLRDCRPLSLLGLAKACIEMQLWRTLTQFFTIALAYFYFGALFALFCRLTQEIHQCWNTKLPQYQPFGEFADKLYRLINWLPARLFSLLILLLHPTALNHAIRQPMKPYWFRFDHTIALYSLAVALNVTLSGVAMYQGQKYRTTKLNAQAPEPTINHVNRCYQQLVLLQVVSVVLLSLSSLF
jgi:adenosylcobinamide-phosphate synthase